MTHQTTLPIPGARPRNARHDAPIDKAEYRRLIAARWHGECLRDAARNLRDFEEIHAQLCEAMVLFARDPWMNNLVGDCMNPEGTLSSFLWKLQTALQPDRSRLHPLMDFNDSSQTCFLRRGLIAYCTLLLRNIQTQEV